MQPHACGQGSEAAGPIYERGLGGGQAKGRNGHTPTADGALPRGLRA